MSEPLRALIVTRLSRVTDTTTSPERQLQACRDLIASRGWTEVGNVYDGDVSASKTRPFERPELGDWLTNRFPEFDVIVVYRIDRLVRSVSHLAEMIDWSQERNIAIVSATESHFDLSSKMGKVVAMLVASIAEMESDATRERVKSAYDHNRKAGKYIGGTPPWGYTTDRVDDGYVYVPDHEHRRVIREVAQRVLDGEPLRTIVRDLDQRGVRTPMDRYRELQGKPVKGTKWNHIQLSRCLKSEAMLGYATAGDGVIRNPDGSPMMRTEPVLSREVYDRVVRELEARSKRREKYRKPNESLLLGVIKCGRCGRPVYQKRASGSTRKDRYLCYSAQENDPCGNSSLIKESADDTVEAAVLALLGDSERLERVWDEGVDNSEELSEIEAQLADLTGIIGTGPYKAGTPLRAQLDQRIAGLAERHEQLAAEGVAPSGWTYRGTGERFSDWWGRQTVEQRNVWLRENNVTMTYTRENRPGRGGRRPPSFELDLGDIYQLTEQLTPKGAAAAWSDALEQMKALGVSGATYGTSGWELQP
ncbi:recombinase family protein [Tsukamurella sp. 8F]|uniref:recombinase family protein n=1 Tax=Tsukamurella sp. 8J TaxID=3031962 RepID=UPI0023B9EFD5|nr:MULTISPECIES: recombinase family protein [unclassified Tsukamurella]MDF0530902.1 recombinase family protein [Tsukamurella sp. 8J]MDF0588153.1 recombinase family protein [Tsukamurella sp. 8F]